MRSIESLLITQVRPKPQVHDVDYGNIEIYGEPFHADAGSIEARYRHDPLDDFLAREARFGIGNYVVVETRQNFCRIVTSLGYCGGYYAEKDGHAVVGTLLASVLASMSQKPEMEAFAICFFLSRAVKSSVGQFPFTSMFKDVTRIPPGTVVELENGKVKSFYSFLLLARQLPLPSSFEEAMEETSTALADHYYRTRRAPLVMFSGGVDSLLIYLALRRKMGERAVRLATMDHSTSNGPRRAHPIAMKLGATIEHYSLETLNNERTMTVIRDMMSQEIITSRAPHLALIANPPGADLLHGQTMDSMVKIGMTILQANLDRGYLSKGKTIDSQTDEAKLRQYETFIENLLFTHDYLDSTGFQRDTQYFYAKHTKLSLLPHPGLDGVIRGMLVSQHPNLYYKSPFPQHQAIALRDEGLRFRSYVGPQGLKKQFIVDLLRFTTYAHMSSKRLSSLSLADGSRVFPVAMSGPISSYCIGRRRGLQDAARPKREIYELVEKYAGMSYTDLASEQGGKHRYLGNSKRGEHNEILFANRVLLRPENSRVVKAISNSEIQAYIEGIYKSFSDADSHNAFALSQARYMLNLELIMARAEKSSVADDFLSSSHGRKAASE